jgi:hypothetical protein
MFNGNSGGNSEIAVSPPETLLKFDAPLFAGIEPSHAEKLALNTSNQESNPKIDDMVNSMLPPRYCVVSLFCLPLHFGKTRLLTAAG